MRSYLVLVWVLFTGLSQAADEPNTIADCRSFVFDGGYSVQITKKSLGGNLVAHVSKRSFLGTTPLATVEVDEIDNVDGKLYPDKETEGRKLLIGIDLNKPLGEDRYEGFIVGFQNGERIPPKKFKEWGKISCHYYRN